MLVLNEPVPQPLFEIGCPSPQLRNPVDHVGRQMETVHVVAHHHVEGRGGGAFLLITTHMEILAGMPSKESTRPCAKPQKPGPKNCKD